VAAQVGAQKVVDLETMIAGNDVAPAAVRSKKPAQLKTKPSPKLASRKNTRGVRKA
jgi:hypothetical protein